MYQFLETIRLEDGIFINQEYHQARIDETSKVFNCAKFNLCNILIPQEFSKGLYKTRIIYSSIIESIEFQNYKIKAIGQLKLIECNDITYNYKFLNRISINNLLNQLDECDDIIIIKNGELTDSSYANIIFEKNSEFFTPQHPLLNGTKRKFLINQKEIVPLLIKPNDIDIFENCRIINAMINIEESPIIKNIKF